MRAAVWFITMAACCLGREQTGNDGFTGHAPTDQLGPGRSLLESVIKTKLKNILVPIKCQTQAVLMAVQTLSSTLKGTFATQLLTLLSFNVDPPTCYTENSISFMSSPTQ